MFQNQIIVIAPYKWQNLWVFDDLLTGLVREPFVNGVPEILDRLLQEQNVKDPDKGFRLIFSATPFPGFQLEATLVGPEYGGNWYKTPLGEQGWLCPALFKYFPEAPPKLYAKVEQILDRGCENG